MQDAGSLRVGDDLPGAGTPHVQLGRDANRGAGARPERGFGAGPDVYMHITRRGEGAEKLLR